VFFCECNEYAFALFPMKLATPPPCERAELERSGSGAQHDLYKNPKEVVLGFALRASPTPVTHGWQWIRQ